MLSVLESIASHKLELARDLLEDIELNRLSPDALLLKGSRLARLVGNGNVQDWLAMELGGYTFTEPEKATRFADVVGRFSDRPKKLGWWWPLAEIEARIAALQVELKQCRVPDVQLNLSSATPPMNSLPGSVGQRHSKFLHPSTKYLTGWRLRRRRSTLSAAYDHGC